jgi:hypothetical protein
VVKRHEDELAHGALLQGNVQAEVDVLDAAATGVDDRVDASEAAQRVVPALRSKSVM